jgi:CheY-like chemotaxis protein
LLNLLTNAVKYTNEGNVTLRVRYDRYGSGLFRCDVIDTGIGIAENNRTIIFDPFIHLDADGKTREGTGLGLFIVKKLVTLMQGKVDVESRPGKGSTFRVELPLPEAEDQVTMEEPKDTITGYQGNRKKVLVVDDNITNASLLVSILAPLGFEVVTAENGRVAVQQALSNPPDLVLLDLVMLEMDGLDTIHEMRCHPSLAQTKIIGISATVTDSERKNAFVAACDGFVAKPVHVEILLNTIHEKIKIVWELAPSAGRPDVSGDVNEHKVPEMVPQENILVMLQQAVDEGDFGALEQILMDLLKTDPSCTAFCRHIRQYAARYDEEGISGYLDKIRSERHGVRDK